MLIPAAAPRPCLLGLVLALLATPLPAQPAPTPIDPNWVYITPVRWVHAVPAAGIDERTAYATVFVLYPTGDYAELSSGLIEHGREHAVTFSNFEGLEIRRGTWTRVPNESRANAGAIRISSREILKLSRSPARILCDPRGQDCTPEPHPAPGPLVTETCATRGNGKTHLAAAILCKRMTAAPVRINLSLTDLENLTAPAKP